MLAQLPTIKTRLALLDTDPTYDALLTSAIKALSARFDRDCNRTLARAVDTTFEFDASDTEIVPPCYPIESVKGFALKTDEAQGWVPQPQPTFLIRKSCIISLAVPLSQPTTLTQIPIAQITYTGGYVLPGTDPLAGQKALPPDIEDAVTEQIAFWFQRRDKLGIHTYWPRDAAYQQWTVQDLLPSVEATLNRYRRYTL